MTTTFPNHHETTINAIKCVRWQLGVAVAGVTLMCAFASVIANAITFKEDAAITFDADTSPSPGFENFTSGMEAVLAAIPYYRRNEPAECPHIITNPGPGAPSNSPQTYHNGEPRFWGFMAEVGYMDWDFSQSPAKLVCRHQPPSWNVVAYAQPRCGDGTLGPTYDTVDATNYKHRCIETVPDKVGDPNTCVGNPVLLTSGDKIQAETDYSSSVGLTFTRSYRSNLSGFFGQNSVRVIDRSGTAPVSSCVMGTFTKQTAQGVVRASHCFQIVGDGTAEYQLTKSNGYTTVFTGAPTAPTKPANLNDSAVQLTDAQGVKTWRVTDENDTVEIYTAGGLLKLQTTRAGQQSTFAYSDTTTPTSIAPRPNFMISQTGPFGHKLQWRYGPTGLMTKMIDPAGGEYDYAYDANFNLASVAYPPTIPGATRAVRTYHYEATNNIKLLTGITDENGVRFSTYRYGAGIVNGVDLNNRVLETKHFAAPGVEVNRYQFAYPTFGQTTMTDPLNTSRTYNYTSILNYDSVTSTSQPCTTCGGNNSQATTYDANRNVTARTDFRGFKTCYAYDLARNLETTRVEGLPSATVCSTAITGTVAAPARKTTTLWHPTFRIPTSITDTVNGGTRQTTFTHDANGNVLTRTVATLAGTRVWTYTYDAYGRILTATDPRNFTTTNTYYPNTEAQNSVIAHSRGMLASVTNALGHTTNITAYNAHGQPLSMTDANGLTTTMTYDARMRLTSRNVGGETTGYEYDGVGQLTKVTMADGSFLTYTYDGAHRLTQIQDGLANKVVYTLDGMGNRIAENYTDPAGALSRSRTRVYDALNRLQRDIGGSTPASQITQYGYDNNGNQTSITDPLSRTTGQVFDALNRLIQVNDANTPSGATKYEYDAQDNLTKVTDAKNLATTYAYNGFNELTSQVSPDTGTTSFTYDGAGNMLTKTDARGVTATYTYDALNRVTTIAYPAYQSDPAETVIYTYDTCANGKGRLCSLADKTGTTTYSYDQKGRVLAKAQTVAGLTQTLGYRYNAAGQMDEMTLPSGKKVALGYSNNRVVSVTYDGNKPIVKNADYEPFGPVGEWTWGNDTPAVPNKHTRYFDLDGRTTKIESGTGNIQPTVIVYDAASRITALQKLTGAAIDPAKSNTYGYDNLDRLTSITPGAGNPQPTRGYTYDAIGNRLTQTTAGATTNYSYGTTSHWLNALSGATAKTYTHDAAGNRIADGIQSWIYGGNNRPTTVTVSGATLTTVQASINALGQRVAKTVNGTRTRYVYDEGGRLVGEYTNTGQPLQETIWFNDLPVAVIK